ncbi:transposase [Limosilactobacillus mucosae]|nr:transposase [Limosilactobacillus mucosae]MDC2840276.1 transposase [Limosilactobacillus mucosae]
MFEIGELPLSNNSVEQSIQLSTIIRKNSLFAKYTAGAEANVIFYTIVQTAKLNHLDVFKYLKLIFEALFTVESNRSANLRQIKSLG